MVQHGTINVLRDLKKKKGNKNRKKIFNYDGRGMITYTHTHNKEISRNFTRIYPLLLLF
jgi:uncharacterized protein YkuJ